MRSDTVFDTHEIARSLTAADLTDAQADAITAAVRRAVEHDAAAAVDVDALATKADVRAELAALEARIYRAMLIQAGAIVGALVGIAGMVFGALRLLGSGS